MKERLLVMNGQRIVQVEKEGAEVIGRDSTRGGSRAARNGCAITDIHIEVNVDWATGSSGNVVIEEADAGALKLNVAPVQIVPVAGTLVLLVQRYDRVPTQTSKQQPDQQPTTSYQRLHQEDLCQATGTSPVLKYEADVQKAKRMMGNGGRSRPSGR